VYYEKYLQGLKTKDASESGAYRVKSKEYLLKAFEAAKGNLPSDFEHVKRLKYKVNQRAF
jgi:hypothetical protein